MWDFVSGQRVVLASGSSRRKELLAQSGLWFVQLTPVVDERLNAGTDPAAGAIELSRRKAEWAANVGEPGWIIGADTVVIAGDEALGKPLDEEGARRMLKSLSGCTHQVITGFTILHSPGGRFVSDHVSTDVTFLPLSAEDIESYISTGEWRDKAGGYGVQGYGGLLIERIEGCYYNVVGLPISRLRSRFREFMGEIDGG